MPESEIVRRINVERAVIAPATVGVRLMTRTLDEERFALRQVIWRIARQSPRIFNRRLGAAARDGISDRYVSLSVNRNARHPAQQAVAAIIKALLL